ncbi:pseudouridine kinase [Dongia mobilis]|uniref:Pseudouridine kinase n=1 Tax=Dongia mobilis TaxID=578943 RepID=A0A4R6WXR3_9PROT|nr:carbohydrate kinase family protein [Dongia mobilis]TDQ84223.1 pseudouridine kinase [Dongia mobilis]
MPKIIAPKITGPKIIVLGGANLDIKSRIAGKAVPRTSNPGSNVTSAGGVARNIAENLALAGADVALFSIVGNDAMGDRLRREARASGIDTTLLAWRRGATGSYNAILDAKGELVIAVSDMRLMDALTPADIERHAQTLAAADLLVADCNLPGPCLTALARIAADAGRPLVIDPVSVPKAARLGAVLKARLPLAALTPNRDELAALTRRPVASARDLAAAAQALHARGVDQVLVGLGKAGCFLSGADGRQQAIPARGRGRILDVTGAGDAMVAGFALGLASGRSALQSARKGQEMASRAVRSARSVATG